MPEDISIDFDKFGHCVVCSTNMIIDRVVEGELIQMFSPKKTDLKLLLNDGSQMSVSICKRCKQNIKDSDLPIIMNKVFKGWELETAGLVMRRHKNESTSKPWDNKKRDDYLKRMKKLEVVTVSENKGKDVLEKKLKKFEEDKKKKPKKVKAK